jgi:cytochrome c
MDSGTFNKWMGAVLSALLVLFGLRTLMAELRHDGPPAKPGYEVAMTDDTVPAAPAGPVVPDPPVAELLKVADVATGQGLAKACTSCHAFEKGGAAKAGPVLYGVVNRAVGSVDGYAYSAPMKGKGGAWDYAHLYEFLKNPKATVPGTKMSYAGLKKPADRAAVIAYLRSLADAPAPLP